MWASFLPCCITALNREPKWNRMFPEPKLHVTNDASWLLLLRQHELEFTFTFPLFASECVPFRKSTRKYYIFRVKRTRKKRRRLIYKPKLKCMSSWKLILDSLVPITSNFKMLLEGFHDLLLIWNKVKHCFFFKYFNICKTVSIYKTF